MQIVIPMSGEGRRFVKAGYRVPKPLIEIDGKPVIEHVINLFPGEQDFIFICNNEHLHATALRKTLERLAPAGKIIGIEPHKKGPVYAVAQAFQHIPDTSEVIVNYCDFSMYWDYHDFLRHTRYRGAAGALACYKGFHPHMLGNDHYAFVRDNQQWLLEIKEKEPFTNNRIEEFASSGTYYFQKGAYVKSYFKQLMDRDIALNGEYYVSLVYNLMVEQGLKISIYEIQHMLQWGTPQDVEDYKKWSGYFKNIILPYRKPASEPGSINLIPLAGKGTRFAREGYKNPKPLIEVSGKPMVIQAADALPPAEQHIFIVLKEHLDNSPLAQVLKQNQPDARIVALEHVTQGQACTVEQGLAGVNPDAPLFIGACDNAMLFDAASYEKLRKTSDAIVFTFRNHVSVRRTPDIYGYVDADAAGNATRCSVKKPLSETPWLDHAIVGAFYFKKARYFLEGLAELYHKHETINGEYYADSVIGALIRQNKKVRVFDVENYIGFGTPDDLRSFEYWQSFFHKCNWHPYALQKDPTIDQKKTPELIARYTGFAQSCQ